MYCSFLCLCTYCSNSQYYFRCCWCKQGISKLVDRGMCKKGKSKLTDCPTSTLIQRVHVDKCHPYLLWLFHLLSENRYTAVGTVLDSAFQEGIDVYTDVINVVTVWQPRGSESDILSNVLRIHKLNAQQNPVVAFLRSIFLLTNYGISLRL